MSDFAGFVCIVAALAVAAIVYYCWRLWRDRE